MHRVLDGIPWLFVGRRARGLLDDALGELALSGAAGPSNPTDGGWRKCNLHHMWEKMAESRERELSLELREEVIQLRSQLQLMQAESNRVLRLRWPGLIHHLIQSIVALAFAPLPPLPEQPLSVLHWSVPNHEVNIVWAQACNEYSEFLKSAGPDPDSVRNEGRIAVVLVTTEPLHGSGAALSIKREGGAAVRVLQELVWQDVAYGSNNMKHVVAEQFGMPFERQILFTGKVAQHHSNRYLADPDRHYVAAVHCELVLLHDSPIRQSSKQPLPICVFCAND